MSNQLKDLIIYRVGDYLNEINSFEEQHISNWIFRGHSNIDFKLIPSLFRIDISDCYQSWEVVEEYMLESFRREAQPHLKIIPQDEIEWLTLAQHHGLPTRLLDWTSSPLIALYIAVADFQNNKDAIVWSYGSSSVNNCHPESTPIARNIGCTTQGLLLPNHISPRVTNQLGCFTLHEAPKGKENFIPLNEQDLGFAIFQRFIIKAETKKDVYNQLYKLGISEALIYPGLEGVAKKIKFELLNTVKRNSNEKQVKALLKKK